MYEWIIEMILETLPVPAGLSSQTYDFLTIFLGLVVSVVHEKVWGGTLSPSVLVFVAMNNGWSEINANLLKFMKP